MTRLIRSEFLKLRTIILPFVLLGGAVVLTAFMASVKAFRAGGIGHMAIPPLDTSAGLSAVLTSTNFALLLALVFGAIVATSEFRHGTATATYLASPRRSRVLAAKALAAGAFGLLFGLVGGIVATAIGVGFVSAEGLDFTVSAATMAQYVGGATLASAILAVAGVGLGSLLRDQLLATIVAFAWGFVIEQIVATLVTSVAPYLPFTAATSLGGVTVGDATMLPFAWSAVLVLAIGAVLLAVASRVTVPRDVS
jgi:ABC-type transport system involved in multi-copper enzyme maturation permease subunit